MRKYSHRMLNAQSPDLSRIIGGFDSSIFLNGSSKKQKHERKTARPNAGLKNMSWS